MVKTLVILTVDLSSAVAWMRWWDLGRVPGVGEDFWICDPWTPTLRVKIGFLPSTYIQPSQLYNDLWRFGSM